LRKPLPHLLRADRPRDCGRDLPQRAQRSGEAAGGMTRTRLRAR
jgi:hypothetical protein